MWPFFLGHTNSLALQIDVNNGINKLKLLSLLVL